MQKVDVGTPAPDFKLTDVVSGDVVALSDFDGTSALLVTFICNHCPYVQHINEGLAQFARDYGDKDLAMVAIMPNDIAAYPDDAPAELVAQAERFGFTFPYLYDETQEVARAYGAVCTPDFFLYDGDRRLAYRGQFDDSRPRTDIPVTGADLRAAVDSVLAGEAPRAEQKPPMGCSIKWRDDTIRIG